MSAPAFRSVSTFDAGGGRTSVTLSKPSGTTDGDILVACVACGGPGITIAPPDGTWALLDNQSAGGPSVRTFYKIASSEGADYTFTWTGSVAASAFVAAYSGGDGTSPINQHSAWDRATSTTTCTADSVTTTVNECMILFVGVNNNGSSFTGPSGYTSRVSTGSSSGVGLKLAELGQASAGATGNVTATCNSGNTEGTLIALAPPAAAAGLVPKVMMF